MNVFDKCHVKSWTVSVLLEISLLASKLVSGGESTLNLSLHPSFSCYRWLSCCPVQIKGLCADYVFLLSCNKIIHPETAGRPSQGHLKEVNDPVQDVFALLINTPLVDNKPLHWMQRFKKKKLKSTDVFRQAATARGWGNLVLPVAHVARQSAATGSNPNPQHLITCSSTELWFWLHLLFAHFIQQQTESRAGQNH